MNPLSEIPQIPNPLTTAKFISNRTLNKTYQQYGTVREDSSTVRRGDKDLVMSRSELSEFDRCPNRWVMGYRDEENDSMTWGTKLESPVFGIEKLIPCPATYVNSKGKEEPWTWKSSTCRDWRDEQGAPVSDADEMARLSLAAQRVKEFMIDAKPEEFQVMLISTYEDAETGITVNLKHLIDWLPASDRTIWDLKSGKSANPAAWGNSVHSYRYHWQAAMELDAANLVFPDRDYVSFNHIVQESYPPYHVEDIMLSESWLLIGRLEYASALRKYCRCLATGEWPGYPANQKFGRASLCEPKPWQLDSQN